MSSIFEGKKVLVTGGGSLGRELVKLLLEYKAYVKCLDQSEQALFNLQLKTGRSKNLEVFLVDIIDYDSVETVASDMDYVIHTVAKKFLNYVEIDPLLAIKTNVDGTQNIIKACIRSNSVQKMINISTDKACNPTTIYGLTKSLGEHLVSWANGMNGKIFSSIRCPNFMPSDGSCFQIWEEEARRGDFITVTDERMVRWFIPIEEVAKLTLEALTLSEGGEVFVPSTAKEHKIIDLALEYGRSLQFIGMRNGEKLREILITPEEEKRAKLKGDLWRFKL